MILPFHGLQFVLELKSVPYQQKQKLRKTITKNGGKISYLLTKTTNFVVVNDCWDTYKTRNAFKLNLPVVNEDFVYECDRQRKLLPFNSYLSQNDQKLEKYNKGCIVLEKNVKISKTLSSEVDFNKMIWKSFRSDEEFTGNLCKYAILKGTRNGNGIICVFELHLSKSNLVESANVLSFTYDGKFSSCKLANQQYCTFENSQDAENAYVYFGEMFVKSVESFERLYKIPREPEIGSTKLRLWLDEMKCMTGDLHPNISQLVIRIWQDAIGTVSDKLNKNLEILNAEKIINGLSILLNIKICLDDKVKCSKLMTDFCSYIPITNKPKVVSKRAISHLEELCQLLKDLISVTEVSLIDKFDPSNFYKAMKCSIHCLDPKMKEFQIIEDEIMETTETNFIICNVFKVVRREEECSFDSKLGNIRTLYHSSKQDNFVGILLHGLLLPAESTEKFGISRSDPGNLGSGLYFTDSVQSSASYSSVSKTRGTRLMLVHDVALGSSHQIFKSDPTITNPPSGYQSVHGVPSEKGDFVTNEYAIYNTNQQRIKYLIEFKLKGDEEKIMETTSLKNEKTLSSSAYDDKLDLSSIKHPLDTEKLGLIAEYNGESYPVDLKEVHTRANLIDFCAEVVLFQAYENQTSQTLEAKYVFPLPDNAAVCGFEAFINNKHVVGEVKEKEQARKEYKKAVSEGHGAYLMDQETANLFTVSIGNIPPNARVIIKITYVSELSITTDLEEPKILFNLPGRLTNWNNDKILSNTGITQSTTTMTSVKKNTGVSSLEISIDMPFDITSIKSQTHKIVSKQTKSKACVRLSRKQNLADNDFILQIAVAEIHVPRMWVEKDDLHQANMVSFYPEFEYEQVKSYEAVIIMDMSNSMENCYSEVRAIAGSLLENLSKDSFFNILKFGSYFEELFLGSKKINKTHLGTAHEFINQSKPNMGFSYGGQILSSFCMIKKDMPLNLFLISDGCIDNKIDCINAAVQLFQQGGRVFVLGIGSYKDDHFLRAIALKSGGFYENFDKDKKSKWISKIQEQCRKASQPALNKAEIVWITHEENFFEKNPCLPIKSPAYVTSVFNGSRILAYSFIPNCMQAELRATVGNREFSMIVSASELSVLQGKTLHRLTAKALIYDHEYNNLNCDESLHNMLKKTRKGHITKMSIQYNVVSPYTSFIAVEKRDKNENLSTRLGPSVADIVRKVNVDLIPEIAWEVNEEELTTEQKVIKIIKEISVIENCSVLQARELSNSCFEISKHLSIDSPLTLIVTSNWLKHCETPSENDYNNNELLEKVLQRPLIFKNMINYEKVKEIILNRNELDYKTSLIHLSKLIFSPIELDAVEASASQYQPLLIACFVDFLREKKTITGDEIRKLQDCIGHSSNESPRDLDVFFKNFAKLYGEMKRESAHRSRGSRFANCLQMNPTFINSTFMNPIFMNSTFSAANYYTSAQHNIPPQQMLYAPLNAHYTPKLPSIGCSSLPLPANSSPLPSEGNLSLSPLEDSLHPRSLRGSSLPPPSEDSPPPPPTGDFTLLSLKGAPHTLSRQKHGLQRSRKRNNITESRLTDVELSQYIYSNSSNQTFAAKKLGYTEKTVIQDGFSGGSFYGYSSKQSNRSSALKIPLAPCEIQEEVEFLDLDLCNLHKYNKRHQFLGAITDKSQACNNEENSIALKQFGGATDELEIQQENNNLLEVELKRSPGQWLDSEVFPSTHPKGSPPLPRSHISLSSKSVVPRIPPRDYCRILHNNIKQCDAKTESQMQPEQELVSRSKTVFEKGLKKKSFGHRKPELLKQSSMIQYDCYDKVDGLPSSSDDDDCDRDRSIEETRKNNWSLMSKTSCDSSLNFPPEETDEKHLLKEIDFYYPLGDFKIVTSLTLHEKENEICSLISNSKYKNLLDLSEIDFT